MPNTTEGLLLVIGGLFLMIGLIGGGFEVSAAKIPPVGKWGRIGSAVAGVIFLVLALRSIAGRQVQSSAPTPIVSNQSANLTAAPNTTTVAPSPASPTDTTTAVAAVGTATEPAPGSYYRLRLKENKQYLDADHCGNKLALNPGSDYAEGACELFRFVPAGDGWSRLQLKHGEQYLHADQCSTPVILAPISDVEDGACQLWRLVPAGEGWSRLQLKHDRQFLDACSPQIGARPESNVDGGACQLWRLTPQ